VSTTDDALGSQAVSQTAFAASSYSLIVSDALKVRRMNRGCVGGDEDVERAVQRVESSTGSRGSARTRKCCQDCSTEKE
jgi:hypothetical protein